MNLSDADIRYRWTSEEAHKLYTAYENELRRLITQRAVDLGIQMDDGDEQTATELLKQNRRLRMSDEHRAEAWESWRQVIDPLVKRMADLYATHTVPEIFITKSNI